MYLSLKFSTSGLVFQVIKRQECPVNLSSSSRSSSTSLVLLLPADPLDLVLLLADLGDLDDLLDLADNVGDLTDLDGDLTEDRCVGVSEDKVECGS